jgi:hypothetical protein
LLKRSDWQYHSIQVRPGSGGYRVVQSEAANKYGWTELHLPVDTKRYPLLRVQVQGASPRAKWTVKLQFPPHQEEWLITDTDQNGTFNFPVGEYLESYPQGEAIVRFFVIGDFGATVTLKGLEFVEAGASVEERITIHEDRPLQTMDGAGGQADYALWTVGKQYDHVSSAEIHELLSQLKHNGVSIARVGAYGDVIQAATRDPTRSAAAVSYPSLTGTTRGGHQASFRRLVCPSGNSGAEAENRCLARIVCPPLYRVSGVLRGASCAYRLF